MSRLGPCPLPSLGTVLKVAVRWERISREAGCPSLLKSFPPSAGLYLPPSLPGQPVCFTAAVKEIGSLDYQARRGSSRQSSASTPTPGKGSRVLNPLCAGPSALPEAGSRLRERGLCSPHSRSPLALTQVLMPQPPSRSISFFW